MSWKIDKTFCYQIGKDKLRTYDPHMDTYPGDDYTIDCFMVFHYFKDYYKITAIDLRKQ